MWIEDPLRCRGQPCKKEKTCFTAFSILFSCRSFRKQAFKDLLENKKSEAQTSLFFAERGGFEPPVPVTQYVSLANWWFQPLTHLSVLNRELSEIRKSERKDTHNNCNAKNIYENIFHNSLLVDFFQNPSL